MEETSGKKLASGLLSSTAIASLSPSTDISFAFSLQQASRGSRKHIQTLARKEREHLFHLASVLSSSKTRTLVICSLFRFTLHLISRRWRHKRIRIRRASGSLVCNYSPCVTLTSCGCECGCECWGGKEVFLAKVSNSFILDPPFWRGKKFRSHWV